MLVRQQRLDLRVVEKLDHEFGKHLAVLQSVAALREGGRVPDRVVGRKPHEPAVQEIVVQLLHQLACADKRIRIISVTNKGRKLVESAEPKWRQAQEALMDTIGEDRWRAMCTVLRDTTRMVRHRTTTAD